MRLTEDAACTRGNIELVDDRRSRVARKCITDRLRLAGAGKAAGCPDTREDNLSKRDAIQCPALHIAARIPEVGHNQRLPDEADALTGVIAFRDDFNRIAKWLANVETDDTLSGCPIVGQDVKRWAIVAEDAICRFADG